MTDFEILKQYCAGHRSCMEECIMYKYCERFKKYSPDMWDVHQIQYKIQQIREAMGNVD